MIEIEAKEVEEIGFTVLVKFCSILHFVSSGGWLEYYKCCFEILPLNYVEYHAEIFIVLEENTVVAYGWKYIEENMIKMVLHRLENQCIVASVTFVF